MWPPSWTASSSGRTSGRVILDRIHQGAGTDGPYLLAAHCVSENQQHLRRETWEDRRARLPRGDAIPRGL